MTRHQLKEKLEAIDDKAELLYLFMTVIILISGIHLICSLVFAWESMSDLSVYVLIGGFTGFKVHQSNTERKKIKVVEEFTKENELEE